MSILKPKRFWKEAKAAPCDAGWRVELDGRPVRSPAKTLLVLPTLALAETVAAEWDAQDGQIDPRTMPFTRTANSAMDKVATQFGEVAAMLAEYGGSDLLCYRATSPAELIARQAEAWDPLLTWLERETGVRLQTGAGVMHVAQEAEGQRVLSKLVHQFSAFELAAFHDLVGISGSLILALAATRDCLPIDEIWRLSRVDEDWQAEQWGEDEEASAQAEVKRLEFLHAKRFFDLAKIA